MHAHAHTYMQMYIHDMYIHIHDMHIHIHACIHTYIHACIHTYIHTHIHTHIHTYIHTYMHTYIHTYIHTYMNALSHPNTHTYIRTYIHACKIHAHTHIYTCIHACTQTHIHTRTYIQYIHTYIHTYIRTHFFPQKQYMCRVHLCYAAPFPSRFSAQATTLESMFAHAFYSIRLPGNEEPIMKDSTRCNIPFYREVSTPEPPRPSPLAHTVLYMTL